MIHETQFFLRISQQLKILTKKTFMNDIKKNLRKIMLERQKNLSESYVEAASRNIHEQIFSSELFRNAENIFTYISTEKEPDTFAVIKKAFSENKKIYVPKCTENKMSAVRIYNMKNLTNKPVDELRTMWSELSKSETQPVH